MAETIASSTPPRPGDQTPKFYAIEVQSEGKTLYVVAERLMVISPEHDRGPAEFIAAQIRAQHLPAAVFASGSDGGGLPPGIISSFQSGRPPSTGVNINIFQNGSEPDPSN